MNGGNRFRTVNGNVGGKLLVSRRIDPQIPTVKRLAFSGSGFPQPADQEKIAIAFQRRPEFLAAGMIANHEPIFVFKNVDAQIGNVSTVRAGVGAFDLIRSNSMRRFFARAARVPLSSSGWVAP